MVGVSANGTGLAGEEGELVSYEKRKGAESGSTPFLFHADYGVKPTLVHKGAGSKRMPLATTMCTLRML